MICSSGVSFGLLQETFRAQRSVLRTRKECATGRGTILASWSHDSILMGHYRRVVEMSLRRDWWPERLFPVWFLTICFWTELHPKVSLQGFVAADCTQIRVCSYAGSRTTHGFAWYRIQVRAVSGQLLDLKENRMCFIQNRRIINDSAKRAGSPLLNKYVP